MATARAKRSPAARRPRKSGLPGELQSFAAVANTWRGRIAKAKNGPWPMVFVAVANVALFQGNTDSRPEAVQEVAAARNSLKKQQLRRHHLAMLLLCSKYARKPRRGRRRGSNSNRSDRRQAAMRGP